MDRGSIGDADDQAVFGENPGHRLAPRLGASRMQELIAAISPATLKNLAALFPLAERPATKPGQGAQENSCRRPILDRGWILAA